MSSPLSLGSCLQCINTYKSFSSLKSPPLTLSPLLKLLLPLSPSFPSIIQILKLYYWFPLLPSSHSLLIHCNLTSHIFPSRGTSKSWVINAFPSQISQASLYFFLWHLALNIFLKHSLALVSAILLTCHFSAISWEAVYKLLQSLNSRSTSFMSYCKTFFTGTLPRWFLYLLMFENHWL